MDAAELLLLVVDRLEPRLRVLQAGVLLESRGKRTH